MKNVKYFLLFVTCLLYSKSSISQCNCSSNSGTSQYPSIILYPSVSPQFINNVWGGNYTLFAVSSGNTYTWSYCSNDGGGASWDTRLNLYNNSNLSYITCNGDYSGCGTAAKIVWTANFTGTVRLITNKYTSSSTPCATNQQSATLAYSMESPSPDLIIEEFPTLSQSILKAGGSTTVSFKLINQGSAAAGGSVVSFHISSKPYYDNTAYWIADYFAQSLPSNTNTGIITKTVTLPTNILQGNYYILVSADGTGIVAESNESNQTTYAAFIINPPCVTWVDNIKPFQSIVAEAADFLCEESIIDNYQNALGVDGIDITRKDLAVHLRKALFEASTSIPSDYYPNLFVDISSLGFYEQSAMKMLLYLDYQNGIAPLSRDFFNVLPNISISRAQAIKICLEAFNVLPNMSGYNKNSTATSSFYNDVKVNHPYYGYLQKAAQDFLFPFSNTTCFPSPCINPDISIKKNELWVLLYTIIKKYGYPTPTSSDFFTPNSFEQVNLGNNHSIDRGIFTTHEQESFNIPGGGLPLDFTHYYNSLLTEIPFTCYEVTEVDQEIVKQKFNPLGIGWNHSYNIYIQGIPDAGANPFKDIGLMIWWADGTVQSYNTVLGKYTTEGVTDKLTILQTNSNTGNATVIEIKKKDGTIYKFSEDYPRCLKLDEIRDRNGNKISLTYESVYFGTFAFRRLLKVTDSYSVRAITFQYQANTLYLSSVTDNIGRVIKFDINREDQLLYSYTNAKNIRTEYSYGLPPDAFKVLTKIKLPKGNVVTNQYWKKKLKSTEGNNYKISVDYAPSYSNGWNTTNSSTTIIKNGTSIQTNYKYNFNGNPIEIEDPNASNTRTTIEYNNNTCKNSPTKIISDITGVQTLLSYDGNCNPIEIKSISSAITITETFTYNSESQITSYTDPNNNTTTYVYDLKGNLIENNKPLGVSTKFSYNSNGTLAYVDIPDEGRISFSYNSYGNVGSSKFQTDKISTYSYDALSRLTSTTDEDGNTNAYSYDVNDNTISETINPGGLNLTTTNTYDANDNIVSIASPKGNTTTLTYDFNTDALLSEQLGSFTRSWTYNEDGSIKTTTDRNGKTDTYSYFIDNNNKKGLLKNDGYAEYEYDNRLYLTSVKKDGNSIDYLNDALGRPIEITYNNVTNNKISYQYDNNSNIIKRTYPLINGARLELSLVYDALNRLIEVKNAQTNKSYVKYTYRKNGKLQTEELGNGLVVQYFYDQYANPNKIITSHPTSGNIIDLACNRLKSGKISQETAKFDIPGTISPSNYWNTASSQTYNFDQTNRITSLNSKSLLYNKWMLSDDQYDSSHFEFNSGIDLISIANQITNVSNTFSYDPLKNRRNRNNSLFILDLLDNKNIVASLDNGQPQNIFVYGLGLVCRIDPITGGESYYHYDWKGSTIAVSDSAGNLVKGYYYTPFGDDIQTKGSINFENPFTYVGKYGIVDDKNGYFFMRARYYHPSSGRFISSDPVWSTNLFPYADNDPVNKIDPNGEFSILDFYNNDIKTGAFLGTKYVKSLQDYNENVYINSVVNGKPDNYTLWLGAINSLWTPENWWTTVGALSLAGPSLTGKIGKTGKIPLVDMRRKINRLSKNLYNIAEKIDNYNTFNETMNRYLKLYEKKFH